MKKLNSLLLIHWYGYTREKIDFERINFLTGKTGAGKSVIVDALQLVLLGDTNGNFFNKAANEKSARTLKSYLFGENGDDGETGFRYLRTGPFTSYVVLEFEDTVKNACFLTGFVADCYEDNNYDYKWFVSDYTSLPVNLFTDEKTHTPYNIAQLKTWLKKTAGKKAEVIDTNRRFQEVLLAKYGTLKRKYLTLLRKAVPFTPVTDIEQFITESVCDVKNNIQVEQMQSDIRQYKNLESDAIRTEERIKSLKEISELTRVYEGDKERYRLQSYIIDRAELFELEEEEKKVRREAEEKRKEIEALEEEILALSDSLAALRQEIEKKDIEYHTSDLARRQHDLEEGIAEKKERIRRLQEGLSEAVRHLSDYGKNWGDQIRRTGKTDVTIPEGASEFLQEMSALTRQSLEDFDLSRAVQVTDELKNCFSQFAYELRLRCQQLSRDMEELEERIRNLKKGIKPYPSQVTKLKRLLESELFARFHKTVEVSVFADLLEIRDPEWRDAIEGYLDRQKFNLLLPKEYYKAANEIYESAKKEENIYDTGLVDIGRLQKEFQNKIQEGSLAEEIETEREDARLYADFLLGNVIKCDDVKDLNKYRIAITRTVMLYKGYVSRKLNPARYADPFIGRRSMEILLESLSRQLQEGKKEYGKLSDDHRLVDRAARSAALSEYEAEQYRQAVLNGKELPSLSGELEKLVREYESIDFTWLTKLGEEIRVLKEEEASGQKRQTALQRQSARADEQRRSLEETVLPELAGKTGTLREEMGLKYEKEWMEGVAEPRFQKEAAQEGRVRLTLRESFSRARNQTSTMMDAHVKERRRKRSEYNQDYKMPYDIEREDNTEYDKELHNLSEIRLPQYISQIKDAKEKAYNQFRDDFIAKLKSNIEAVREQINELNNSLKNSVFGTDRYHFTMSPRAEYKNYYDMITDPMLLDTGGWNLTSEQFNAKYQKEIDSLFRALIINETELTAKRREEYEKSIRKFTDYKTYLVFDLIVTNDQGEEQRLSRTLLKKSGGETQIPFYISLLASFSQTCRIRSKGKDNTIRLIILDEAFSKMDGERIRESIPLLRQFGLQAIFSAPSEKISDISPFVDRNIAVYKSGHRSFTRYFDPAMVEEDGFREDDGDGC